MKLYLSSYQVPNTAAMIGLVGKPFSNMKIGLVSNAKDYYIERARKIKVENEIEYFRSLGVQKLTEIDLRDYNNSEEITERIKDMDLVWVMGGNTFMLRYEMKRSGFDSAVREAIAEGVVYGGNSAGAVVAGNSLKGIEHGDESAFAEEVHWDGLNLTDHFILPHVGNNMYDKLSEQAREAHKDDDTIIELQDNQALVINGKVEKKVQSPF